MSSSIISAAIKIQDLSKNYGDRAALSHANFEVPRGVICGFVGPNGSGKTTTIRMLLGLIRPSGGQAWVLGHDVKHPSEFLSKVGAMIEGPAFYPALSGLDNLRVLADMGGFSHDAIGELLELVGLSDRAKSKFKTYSLGMKQRLGIAAALLPDPEVLILDEPTNGLDPAGIHEIRTLLRQLANQGKTIFVSSHLLSELEMISDYVVILRTGEVVFAGKVSELFAAQSPTIMATPENPSDLPTLRALVTSAGYQAKLLTDKLEISAPVSWTAELNRLAFGAGITLSVITPVYPTLEDTFFDMTNVDVNGGKK